MKTIAFSIKGLLAAVTLIAVGLFALMNASYVWSSVVLSFTLLLLLIALVAIVYRRGESRGFWVGFAIFGWGYFILTNPPLGESYRALLPTHTALETLHEPVRQEVELDGRLEDRIASVTQEGVYLGVKWQIDEDRASFCRVGHCLWAWLLAVIGGFMARHFYLVQERSRSAVTE